MESLDAAEANVEREWIERASALICTILWFIISLGGLFRRNSGTGTACGSGSGG
jgi:hypothetical protein